MLQYVLRLYVCNVAHVLLLTENLPEEANRKWPMVNGCHVTRESSRLKPSISKTAGDANAMNH